MGLGNHSLPDTRHSVGMLVVDCLARQLGAIWHFNRRSIGHLAVTNVNDQEIILLKPTVAMNINGRSIARTGIDTQCQMSFKSHVCKAILNSLFACHFHDTTFIFSKKIQFMYIHVFANL